MRRQSLRAFLISRFNARIFEQGTGRDRQLLGCLPVSVLRSFNRSLKYAAGFLQGFSTCTVGPVWDVGCAVAFAISANVARAHDTISSAIRVFGSRMFLTRMTASFPRCVAYAPGLFVACVQLARAGAKHTMSAGRVSPYLRQPCRTSLLCRVLSSPPRSFQISL